MELVEEQKKLPASRKKIKDDVLVPVRIAYGEVELGRMAKDMGGKWDKGSKLWYIPYGNIKKTELEKHIILDAE